MLAEELASALRSVAPSQLTDTGLGSGVEVGTNCWYVVQTQPHAEKQALAHLVRQGLRVFCPCYRKTLRHARRATSVLAPLFPNYLFLHFDPLRDAWRGVNGTRGVVRLLTQGNRPQPLPHGVVETLLAKTNAVGALEWAPTLAIGQTVRIADGPFANLVGELEQLDAAGRVRVLVDLLGRSVSIVLRCEALTAAA